MGRNPTCTLPLARRRDGTGDCRALAPPGQSITGGGHQSPPPPSTLSTSLAMKRPRRRAPLILHAVLATLLPALCYGHPGHVLRLVDHGIVSFPRRPVAQSDL